MLIIVPILALLMISCARPAPGSGAGPGSAPAAPRQAAESPAAPSQAIQAPAPPPRAATYRAGIWLERRWADGSVSRDGVAALVREMAARGMTDLYVRTGPYRADGTLTLPDSQAVAFLHQETQRLGLRLWAWLPGWRTTLALSEGGVIGTAAASAASLAALGFDGVQLDIEPTPDGDADYLNLLDAVQGALPEAKQLGAATHLVRPQPEQAEWTEAYYRQVARRVDQVAVMAYDTYARTPELFREFVAHQTRVALRSSPATTEVLIGVPTYEDRTERHTPEREPTRAGLQGIADGWQSLDLSGRVTGWALFAHYTTDEAEWSLWESRPR